MLKSKKSAFTLAEVMIVLTVIGILSAILLPVAINSTPDKNILKFKKGYNDLTVAVRELISNGKFFMVGDFTYLPDGTVSSPYGSDKANYFMESLADTLTYKNFNVSSDTLITLPDYNTFLDVYPQTKDKFDKICIDYHDKFLTDCTDCNSIELTNGLFIYEPIKFRIINYISYCQEDDPSSYNPQKCKVYKDSVDNVTYCIDLDGEGGILPFGIGIRPDGKISTGKRADWWLSRDITKKETDCCPTALNTEGLCDSGDTVCSE